MIRISYPALSVEMQKQLNAYEEEELEHKQKFTAKKLTSIKLTDEGFDASPEQ